jgi:hypothetical protein
MRPSARELIEGVAWSLQEKVVPVTEDPWATSTLRSVRCLLEHLAQRVEVEGSLLFDDNAEARAALARVSELLVEVDDERVRGWYDHVAVTLARAWRGPEEYPSVSSLTQENTTLRELVDQGIRILHEVATVSDAVRDQARAELDGYVRRRLARDQPLFSPFMANVF